MNKQITFFIWQAEKFSFFFAICVFLACTTMPERRHCESTRLIVNFPVLDARNQLTYMPDTLYIYQRPGYVLYKLPKVQQIFINDSLTETRQAFEYFVYKENDLTGMFYASLDSSTLKGISMPVDSMRFNRGYKADFSRLLQQTRFHRSETSKDELIDYYATGNAGNPQMFDSVYCYYDRGKGNIAYSLDSTMELQKQSKLYKVVILWNQVSTSDGIIYPRRWMEYQISCEEKPDPSVTSFFKNHVANIGR